MEKQTLICLGTAKHAIIDQMMKKEISLDFDENDCSKIYMWTNENVAAYLNALNLNGKNTALTVLASGDQVFNYITKGLTQIDTFDTNKLTEFFALGLKKNMILQNGRIDFLVKMNTLLYGTRDESIEVIKELLPYMEEKYQSFWKGLIEYFYKMSIYHHKDLSIMTFLSNDYFFHNAYQANNNYLHDDKNYEKLKKNLEKANITFKHANANNLHHEFKGQYDLINLSNILDYFALYWGENWSYDRLKEYENYLLQMTSSNAYIILMYIFSHMKKDSRALFTNSTVTEDDLIRERIYTLNNDSMILRRVKGKKDD